MENKFVPKNSTISIGIKKEVSYLSKTNHQFSIISGEGWEKWKMVNLCSDDSWPEGKYVICDTPILK